MSISISGSTANVGTRGPEDVQTGYPRAIFRWTIEYHLKPNVDGSGLPRRTEQTHIVHLSAAPSPSGVEPA